MARVVWSVPDVDRVVVVFFSSLYIAFEMVGTLQLYGWEEYVNLFTQYRFMRRERQPRVCGSTHMTYWRKTLKQRTCV